MKLTINELRQLLNNQDSSNGDVSFYGVVSAVNSTNGVVKSYDVTVGDSVIEARKLAGAELGDIVLCTTLNNGITVVTGRLDGDKDAADAKEYAETVAGDLSDLSDEVDLQAQSIQDVTELAEATNQYFFHDNSGAHVTTEESDGDANYNSVWNSNGLFFRYITNILLSITTTAITMFTNAGNKLMQLSTTALQFFDGDSDYAIATFSGEGQTFNNDYGEEIFKIGKTAYREYSTAPPTGGKVNFFLYNNESPWEIVLPWDFYTTTNSVVITYFSDSDDVTPATTTFTVDWPARKITFPTETCTALQDVSVDRIKVSYDAAGRFPYYTIGSDSEESRGSYSFISGENCSASGATSHAEGESTKALGSNSHSEGFQTIASGRGAHAEGRGTSAEGSESHTEGCGTSAEGIYSHAEGMNSEVLARASHAEGVETSAKGEGSHTEGFRTSTGVNAIYSHAAGIATDATRTAQQVMGMFNVKDTSSDVRIITYDDGTTGRWYAGQYPLIVGNGTSDSNRSNALALSWNGELTLANHSSSIGSLQTASGDNKTIHYYSGSNDTWTNVPDVSLYLDPGSWIVSYSVSVDLNASGKYVNARLYKYQYGDSSTNTLGYNSSRVELHSGSTANLVLQGCIPLTLSEKSTMRVQTYQNAASGITGDVTLRAMRIA